jgi:hypothetical protein
VPAEICSWAGWRPVASRPPATAFAQAGAAVVAVSRTTAPFDEPYGTAGTIQPEAAGATVPTSLIDR